MSQPKQQAGTGHNRTCLDKTWGTPPYLFDAARVYARGQLALDPATNPRNPADAARWCCGDAPGGLWAPQGPEWVSGLEIDWPLEGVVFCNPPYGDSLGPWYRKFGVEAARGVVILSLVPGNRQETTYWQATAPSINAECWHRGRIAFISSVDGAPVSATPFHSVVYGWNVDWPRFRAAFSPLGLCRRVMAVGS